MKIDLYDIMPDDGCALVVTAPTGIIYTAQCGGMLCMHPESEGVYFPIWDLLPEVDDCAHGCFSLTKSPRCDNPELREKFAAIIYSNLQIATRPFSFSMGFNFSKIDELQEAWWPLIINGTFSGVRFDNAECYYHRGNCD